MKKSLLPKDKEWNKFWTLDRERSSYGPSWSKKRIMHLLSAYVSPDKKALDAGCGSGFFSKYFCDQGMDTVSFDYSDEALLIAKKITSNRSKLVKGDLLSKTFKKEMNDKFDIIFSDGLFEHFVAVDQLLIMKNLRAVLSDNGVVVTFVPNKLSPWQIIRPLYMPGIKEMPFVLKDLVALNESSALSVLKKGGINTMPFEFSPDKIFGSVFGMLLFTVSRKLK